MEFVYDSIVRPNADAAVRIAYASKMIVISAGTMGSPAVLERSGIGAADRLERLGIPVIVDLPGVGENYQGLQRALIYSAYLVEPFYRSYAPLSVLLCWPRCRDMRIID